MWWLRHLEGLGDGDSDSDSDGNGDGDGDSDDEDACLPPCSTNMSIVVGQAGSHSLASRPSSGIRLD